MQRQKVVKSSSNKKLEEIMVNVRWIFSVVAGALIAVSPIVAVADNPHNTITLYTQSVDDVSDALSVDFGSPGGGYVQASSLYLTVDHNGNPTGPAIGTIYVACTSLMNPATIVCNATFMFDEGDSINAQGFYTEEGEVPPACPAVTNLLAISGGTGDYQGVQGQLTIIHNGVNPDPNNFCAHSIHNFQFNLQLNHHSDDGLGARLQKKLLQLHKQAKAKKKTSN
jgi:hypothetical protein